MSYRLRRISDKEGCGGTASHFELKLPCTRVGRLSRSQPAHLVLFSTVNPRMISRLHTEFRLQKGACYLVDHSLNGTYLNYRRPDTAELLKPGDVICFGHVNGYNIKAGESVPVFKSELKFVFESTVAEDSGEAGSPAAVNGRQKQPPPSLDDGSGGDASSRDSSDESELEAPAPASRSVDGGADATLAAAAPAPHPSGDETADTPTSSSKTWKTPRARGGGARRGSSGKRRAERVSSAEDEPPASTSSAAKRRRSVAGTAGADSFHLVEEPCAAGTGCSKPADVDVKWVGCDQCEAWYHLVCTRLSHRLTSQQLESLDFVCDRCDGL